MTDRELIRALGGPKRVADLLGIKRQAVTNWGMADRPGIPPARRPAVLALTRAAGIDVDSDEFLRVPTHLGDPSAEAA
jgi:DNA-binding transcriptional regulator YdaS (Cro superfamily)